MGISDRKRIFRTYIRSYHKCRSVPLFSISRADAAYTCQYCKSKISLMFIVSYDLYEVGLVFSVQRFQYFKGKHTFKHTEMTNKRK